MTAVEKIIAEINNELQTLEGLHGKEIFGRKVGLAFAKRVAEQAKEMEKENLIDMSVKSALYERKWVYEEMSDKKYKPTKVEIRDLQETALEHYNITFKSE